MVMPRGPSAPLWAPVDEPLPGASSEPAGDRRRQALLLVGHGSSHGTNAGAPIRAHAERIRRRRIFDEVAVAFVKEEPFVTGALDRLESPDIFVVPVFLSEGYYTQGVVPKRLGVPPVGEPDGNRRTAWHLRQGSRHVRYCPAVGVHPFMKSLIVRRAERLLSSTGIAPAEAALVVAGHGTLRSATSDASAVAVTAELRKAGVFAEVTCGFLDQPPRLEDAVASLASRHVVVVPFFVAEGMHTRETIPQILGLSGRRTDRKDRVIWYAPPVGTLPGIARVVVDLARRAGARVN